MSYLAGDKYSIQGAYSLYCRICSEHGVKQEPLEIFEDSVDILYDVEAILTSLGLETPTWVKEILDDKD